MTESLSYELWQRPTTEDLLPLMTSQSHQGAVQVILFVVFNAALWIQIAMTKVWRYVVSSLAVNETGLAFVGCSFENDTCGWKDATVGQARWARGSNSSNNGPSTDNTLGTKQGEETSFTAHLFSRTYTFYMGSWNKCNDSDVFKMNWTIIRQAEWKCDPVQQLWLLWSSSWEGTLSNSLCICAVLPL